MYIKPGSHVYKVPSEVSDEIAVLSEPMAVAYNLDKLKEISAIPKEGFNFGDEEILKRFGSDFRHIQAGPPDNYEEPSFGDITLVSSL
ncbi:hypothetical protein HKBW3C_02729 [Candidatus Hakubella thermalkaliphila]|nr:hypothetical protein HKBW3C_02729 [Candidatus Hakubella thermalkaliphila]